MLFSWYVLKNELKIHYLSSITDSVINIEIRLEILEINVKRTKFYFKYLILAFPSFVIIVI